MTIHNQTRGGRLADSVEAANTSVKRRKGLLGRDHLPAGHALWIVPCESVHSFFMKFAIDVVYLDRDLRVRKVRTGMKPWRISMCLLAHSVLELPAGTAEQNQIKPGDQLSFSAI